MRILKNRKGATGFSAAGAIIGIVLAAYVLAYTFPSAIVTLSDDTGYAGAGAAVTNICTVVLPIMVMFACVLYLLPSELKAKVGLWYKPKISVLSTNIKGAGGLAAAGAIIGIVLAVYVMAYTLPAIMVEMSCATSYAGAGDAVINIATVVLPIMVAFACVLYLLPSELKSKIGL